MTANKSLKTEKIKKGENKMKNSKIETIKTIVITALVSGIIAFIGGAIYTNNIQSQVKSEAASIVKSVKAQVEQESKQ